MSESPSMPAPPISWTEQLEPWVTLGLCFVLLAIALVGTKSVLDLEQASKLQARSHLRIAASVRLVSLLESARARSYIDRLAPGSRDAGGGAATREDVMRQAAELRRLVSSDPAQGARARMLEILASRQLDRLESAAVGGALATMREEASLMNAVRTVASAVEQEEVSALALRDGGDAHQRVLLLAGLWLLTAIALGVTLGAAWQLHRDVLRLRLDQRTFRSAALHDALTGLSNRRHFAQALRQVLRRRQVTHEPLSLVMIDVDRFKQINDSLGHRVGDQVLRALAARLTEGFRDVDTLSRIGGEEFAVILHGLDRAGAFQVAERVRAAVAAQPVNPGGLYRGEPVPVTVSMGVATLEQGNIQISALIDAADRALYAAKQSGRNRVMLAEPLGRPAP